MAAGSVPFSKRFLSKVDIRAPHECWPWTANRHRKGYGLFKLERRNWKAHRVSWEMYEGQIPPGICVLHHCDNPPCVNPAHLFLGTHKLNAEDRDAKGRNRPCPGEKNGQAVLTADQVREIRTVYAARSKTQVALGRQFGLRQGSISNIVHRRSWAHLA